MNFVGLQVNVKLKPPSSWRIRGEVVHVEAQKLKLQNVTVVDNGARLRTYDIESTDIEDIEVASTFNTNIEETYECSTPRPIPDRNTSSGIIIERPLTTSDNNSQIFQPTKKSTLQSAAFLDPAILTYAKSPAKILASTLEVSMIRPALIESMSARAPEPVSVPQITKKPRTRISTAAALLGKPVSLYAKTVSLRTVPNGQKSPILTPSPVLSSGNFGVAEAAFEVGGSEKDMSRPLNIAESAATINEAVFVPATRSPARRRHTSNQVPASLPPGEFELPNWRQTPLLEQTTKDVPRRARQTTAASSPRIGKAASSARKKSARNQKVLDGWGTEEALDIQEMADFDFVGNLGKFDKQSVFEQLKNDDTTADEDRLISFNRAGPAGTFGGTKLHFSENVIGRPRLASENSDSDVDHELADSTHFRRPPPTASRAGSRMSRPLESARRGTSIGGENSHPEHVERPTSVYATTHRHTQSPHISAGREHALNSPLGIKTRRPSLRYDKTRRVCQTAHPETLAAVAETASKVYSITDDITTEHAGRGIAELALTAINPGSRRIYAGNHNAQPVIVVLAGDNLGGARALAAARHLSERGVRIVAATTAAEDSHGAPFTGLSTAVTPQLLRFGGRAMSWEKAAALLKTLDAPPELIIDGLLDIHTTFADLAASDESVALAMLGWANKSKASVLAVDIPSGVDAVTGQVEVRDGEPLEVRAKIVACCGAPCVGLLRAMDERFGDGQEWLIEVIDIGINGAWRDMPTTSRGGKWVAFGGEWVVRLRYDLSHG